MTVEQFKKEHGNKIPIEDIKSMSEYEWTDGMKCGFTLTLMAGIFLMVVLFMWIQHDWEKDTTALKGLAVKHGAAEWVVDPENGKTHFRWKEQKP